MNLENETEASSPLDTWKRHLVFWSGAAAVGAAAVFFAFASEVAQEQFRKIVAVSPYLPLLVAPAGLALAVVLTRRHFSGAQGSGIPQTIAALAIETQRSRDKVLSFRIAIGKMVLTLVGFLSGASVGREGPTVQIGASIMHGLSRFARFPNHDLDRGLILAGGAAGIAAAFNTPLAGVVFAIEEMSRSFEHRTSGTILIGVILSGVIAVALEGNYSYFGHTSAFIPLGAGWVAVFGCGVLGGALGGIFSRLLLWTGGALPGRIGVFARERPVAFAALCGVVLALLGIASGSSIYGTGYIEAKAIVEGGAPASSGYGFFKMAATIVSYMSGIPGGIFAPSLSAGAGIGAIMAHAMPEAPAGAVVILCMVAYFSGVVQTPITAFVIVMEMTDNHGMVLPLMAASFIGYAISRIVCPIPLYHTLAESFLAKEEPSEALHVPGDPARGNASAPSERSKTRIP